MGDRLNLFRKVIVSALGAMLACGSVHAVAEAANPWLPEPLPAHKRLVCVPEQELLSAYPKYKPTRILMNTGWKQQSPKFSKTLFNVDLASEPESKIECSTKGWKSVTLPSSTYKEFPGSNNKSGHPFVRSWYRNEFTISDADYQTKSFELDFSVASYHVTVFLNGKQIADHKSEFNPWRITLPTDALKPGKNVIAIHHQGDIGKFAEKPIKLTHAYGTQWWRGVLKAGLWGNVTLISTPKAEAKLDVLAAVTSADLKSVSFSHSFKGATAQNKKYVISSYVVPSAVDAPKTKLCKSESKVNGTGKFNTTIDASKLRRWEIGNPYLYDYFVELWNEDKTKLISVTTFRFGVRRFEIKNGEFYFNGRKVYMFAQNTNSNTWDGIGKDPAKLENSIEKNVLRYLNEGHIIIRTAHEPINETYLRVADECGLIIFHEWAWSFSSNLNYEEFSKNSKVELEEFVLYSQKHPSVCALSLGNEIHVYKNEKIAKLVDDNYDLVKKLLADKAMPVSSFSGVGRGFAGDFPLKTDLLDFHTYTSLSGPVGHLQAELAGIVEDNKKRYGEAAARNMPTVAYELVGFSWGIELDPNYQPGDRSEYGRYFKRNFSWGAPQIVGFMGCSPLDIINTKNFEYWARNYYCRRVFDEFRWDSRMRGFAPWYTGAIDEVELWTQPVYPMLRTSNKVVPRNLFGGKQIKLAAAVHNVSNKPYPNAKLKAYLYSDKQQVAELKLSPASINVPDFGHSEKTVVSMTVPKVASGEYRLVIALDDASGKEVGRNYYDVFISKSEAAPIKPIRSAYLLDLAPENTAIAAEALERYGIPYKKVAKATELPVNNSVLIVPPDYATEQVFRGRSKDIIDYLNAGGIILVMEQHNPMTALPGGISIFKHDSSFVDMVYKGHPVFKGLSWKQFETWNNAGGGFVSQTYISPFDWKASLASKGPTIGSPHNFGSAIVEATHGSGRVFINTLQVLRCYKEDSAAATYWENILRYLLESKNLVSDVAAMSGGAAADGSLKSEFAKKIDLRPYANAGFADDVDADKKGGWTDQGPQNFKNVPTGTQVASGIPFDVIGPATNNGLSCIRLKGSARSYFPAIVKGIKVNGKFAKLHFLHTAAWCFKGTACHYRINYADGTTQVFTCASGVHIGDWMAKRDLPEAKVGILAPVGDGMSGCSYVTTWKNPNPNKQIATIDFISAEAFRAGKNEWEAAEDAVPLLLAITGELPGAPSTTASASATPSTYPIDKNNFQRFSSGIKEGNGGSIEPLSGAVGATLKFASHSSNGKAPFAVMFYNPPNGKKIKELVLKVKSKNDDFLRIELPEKGWKGSTNKEFVISGGNEWQEIHIDLRGTKAEKGNLHKEIYFYHKSKTIKADQYPAAEISFKDLVFVLDTPKPVAPEKYEINKGRLTKVSGKISDGNGGKIGLLPASEGVGAYMSFNAYKAAQTKAPFGVIFFTPPPQGGKRSDFVFMAKSDKDIVMELNIPNAGWKGQTIRDVIISGGNEWQEIRVPLKGKPAEQGNLMGQLYFHYKSRSNPKADYPAVNLSIKNLSFE